MTESKVENGEVAQDFAWFVGTIAHDLDWVQDAHNRLEELDEPTTEADWAEYESRVWTLRENVGILNSTVLQFETYCDEQHAELNKPNLKIVSTSDESE